MKQLALLTNSCPAQYTCPCILPFIPLLTERVEMPLPPLSLSGTRTMPLSLRPPPPSLSDPLSLRDYTTRFCAFVRVYGDKSERGLRTNERPPRTAGRHCAPGYGGVLPYRPTATTDRATVRVRPHSLPASSPSLQSPQTFLRAKPSPIARARSPLPLHRATQRRGP